MGQSYSITARLSQDGSLRYLTRHGYSNFASEAAEVLCLDPESLDDSLQDGKHASNLYDLLSRSEFGPEAIFLYTDKWNVLLDDRLYDLESRIQRDNGWFSSLLADRYSVVGMVHDTGDITYIYALHALSTIDAEAIFTLDHEETTQLIQRGDKTEDGRRLGRPKTVSSLFHLFKALGEAPALYNKKQENIFLLRNGNWEVIYHHALLTPEQMLQI